MIDQLLQSFIKKPTNESLIHLFKNADSDEDFDQITNTLLDNEAIFSALNYFQKGYTFYSARRLIEAASFLKRDWANSKKLFTLRMLFVIACERHDISSAGEYLEALETNLKSSDEALLAQYAIMYQLSFGQDKLAESTAHLLLPAITQDVSHASIILQVGLRCGNSKLICEALSSIYGKELLDNLGGHQKNVLSKVIYKRFLEILIESGK